MCSLVGLTPTFPPKRLLSYGQHVYRIELNKYNVEITLDLKKHPDSPRLIAWDTLRAALAAQYDTLIPAAQQQ
jgi:hypothetical protein